MTHNFHYSNQDPANKNHALKKKKKEKEKEYYCLAIVGNVVNL